MTRLVAPALGIALGVAVVLPSSWPALAQEAVALPASVDAAASEESAPARAPRPAPRPPAAATPSPEIAAAVASAQVTRGPVTNLPLPRYVSMKTGEGNARRGPSLRHRIDWVFTARDMPLQITAEFGHWRRVRDRDGAGGWMHYSLLSGVRTTLIEDDMVALRQKPEADGRVMARAEAGAVMRLGRCIPDWCRVSGGGQRGWVPKSALWGVGATELRD